MNTRDDLEVTRHVFRGDVAYVVTDPVNFRSHRLGNGDYQVFAGIRGDETLGATCDWLTASGVLAPDGEEDFYAFVLELHAAGFLSLPISSPDALYERYRRKQSMARRSWLAAPLYFRVPLWNPDRFVERTLGIVAPLFSRGVMITWAVLGLIALVVIVGRWSELVDAGIGVLRLQSLAITWVVLVVLKLLHEFGHAYACRLRGGAVPEMGAFFILLTPCAYVDASAAWSFERTRDRQLVNLGGMYFEALIAIPAILLWATVEPGTLRDVLFLIAMTASVTTIGFNINPLMKFDGYHVLADAWGMPNLQQRAMGALTTVAKRGLLGLKVPPVARGERAALIGYGIGAFIYRITLILGIATLLAMRFGGAGLAAAGLYVAMNVVGRVRRLVGFLVRGEETQPVRRRAVAWAVVLVGVLPLGALTIPVPTVVRSDGVIEPERRDVVLAPVSGTLDRVLVRDGQSVDDGESVLALDEPGLTASIAAAEGRLDSARIRQRLAEADVDRPAASEQARRMVQHAEEVLHERIEDRTRLEVRAPAAGRLVGLVDRRETGRWIERGESLGAIIGGSPLVKVLLTAPELVRVAPRPGQRVELRLRGETGAPRMGRITSIDPSGGRDVELAALTQAGGGRIRTNGDGVAAEQAFFTVTIRFTGPSPEGVIGARATVRFPGESTTIARQLHRRFRAFADRLATG